MSQYIYRLNGLGDFLPANSVIWWEADVRDLVTQNWLLQPKPAHYDNIVQILNDVGLELESDEYKLKLNDSSDKGPIWHLSFRVRPHSAYANEVDAINTVSGKIWNITGNMPTNIDASVVEIGDNVPIKSNNNPSGNKPEYPTKPSNDRCKDKDGLEWVACKFGLDSTAQQLGLGVGAGVTFSLVVILLIGIVILKK